MVQTPPFRSSVGVVLLLASCGPAEVSPKSGRVAEQSSDLAPATSCPQAESVDNKEVVDVFGHQVMLFESMGRCIVNVLTQYDGYCTNPDQPCEFEKGTMLGAAPCHWRRWGSAPPPTFAGHKAAGGAGDVYAILEGDRIQLQVVGGHVNTEPCPSQKVGSWSVPLFIDPRYGVSSGSWEADLYGPILVTHTPKLGEGRE